VYGKLVIISSIHTPSTTTRINRRYIVVVFDPKVPRHGGWCREQQSTAENNNIFKNRFH
jgi:hypothetical protein